MLIASPTNLRSHETERASKGTHPVAVAHRLEGRGAEGKRLLLVVDVERMAVIGDLLRSVPSVDHSDSTSVDAGLFGRGTLSGHRDELPSTRAIAIAMPRRVRAEGVHADRHAIGDER